MQLIGLSSINKGTLPLLLSNTNLRRLIDEVYVN